MNIKETIYWLTQILAESDRRIFNWELQIEDYNLAIEDLEKRKISSNAKKLLYEKYRLDLTKYNCDIRLKTLKNDRFILLQAKKHETKKYHTIKDIIKKLKYNQPISNEEIEYIKDLLIRQNMPDEKLIKTIEYLKIYNEKVDKNVKNSLNSEDLFLILNLLNLGYEKIPEINNINAIKLNDAVNKMISLMESNPLETVQECLNYDDFYSEKDLKYIYSKVLIHYQNEIFELISILKTKEFYFNTEILKEIKDNYKELIQKYIFVRNCFNNVRSESEKYQEVIEPLNETEEEPKNNYYYSSNSLEPEKCYFIKDLFSIREQAYSQILNMLNRFQNGDCTQVKFLEYGFIELKDDQIRIVLKQIKDNNYSVMGVFIKKANNSYNDYNNMYNRPVAVIDDEYSKMVEECYKNYIQENARKGSRA